MDVYLGMIFPFAGNFAPQGFFICAGQTLPISQYQALFAILGTTYGGDGVQTFKLPNLVGNVMTGWSGSTSTGLPLGSAGGASSVTLTTANLPPHNHPIAGTATVSGMTLAVSSGAGSTTAANGNYLANALFPQTADGSYGPYTLPSYAPASAAMTTANIAGLSGTGNLQGLSTQNTGSDTPISVMQPYVVLNFIIAYEGLFPTRG